ncbi:MAG: transglycosylase family protein [Actinomycetota bacterium]
MDRLRFGTTARRKASRQRLTIRLWALSLVAALLGLPGAQLGWQLVGNLGAVRSEDRLRVTRGIETTESAAALLRFQRGVFKARPKPSPTPTETAAEVATAPAPPPAPPGSVSEIIYAAAAEFGLSGSYLLAIASCESGLDPGAYNAAGYTGLFQFDQQTWAAYGYGSIYDPVAQARTAARLIAAGQASRWPNCA